MSAVFIERDGRLPLAHVTTTRLDGSLLDPVGKEGLTRLTVRLMRRTAGGRSADENNERLDALGGSLLGEVQKTHLSLGGAVLSENLRAYLDAVEETWTRPGLFEDEFDRVKDESLAEWYEALENDRGLAFSTFERHVYGDHPLSRPAGGTRSSLEAITHQDVVRHAEALGREPHLLIAGAGDVSPEVLESFAARLTNSAPLSPPPVSEPEAPPGRRLFFVDKPARSQSQIVLGGAGAHPKDKDQVALHVANTIFGGTFTGRLSREIRIKRGWSYGAYSYLSLDRSRGTFSIWTFPEAKDTLACVSLALEMIESLCHQGITKAELTRAQRYLRRSHVFSSDTAQKRVQLRLEEAVYGLEPGYFESFPDKVREVTVEDVNGALRRRISPENLTIAVVGTHSEIGASLESKIPGLKSSRVLRYDHPD
jgi:zinc protease